MRDLEITPVHQRLHRSALGLAMRFAPAILVGAGFVSVVLCAVAALHAFGAARQWSGLSAVELTAASTSAVLGLALLTQRFRSLGRAGIVAGCGALALSGSLATHALYGEATASTWVVWLGLAVLVAAEGGQLVDGLDAKRRRGAELEDAVVCAATRRGPATLRRVGASWLGLLPLLLFGGALRPLAMGLAASLAMAAVATLLVAPVAYLALERGRREEGPPSGPRLAPEPAPW